MFGLRCTKWSNQKMNFGQNGPWLWCGSQKPPVKFTFFQFVLREKEIGLRYGLA